MLFWVHHRNVLSVAQVSNSPYTESCNYGGLEFDGTHLVAVLFRELQKGCNFI